jgi:hypothetical protein
MPIVSTKSRRVIRSVAIWFTFLGIDARVKARTACVVATFHSNKS